MNALSSTIELVPAVVPSPDQLPIFEELTAPPPRPVRPHLRLQPPLLADLTARQRKAVTHGDGPLLIVAGAGTGKTTVLTRRIAWLIAEKRARPPEILALTFTEKAAAEMQERVDRLVPYGYTDSVISTFHAFGDRLLREHALEAGLSDRSTVLSRAEQVIFLREHLFELPLDRYRPLGDPTRFLNALAALFSRARDEDVSPSAYAAAAGEVAARAGSSDDPALAEEAAQQGELAAAYATYERLMRAGDRIDFGDQVGLALRLLREHPAVLAAELARYRYILVDEFQDTNHSQFELVKLLAGGPSANVTVVGAAEHIADSMRNGRHAGEHAVLVRGNRDADPFLRALNMRRIPWRFSGTAGLYQQPEVRVLVSFLRAVADPTDSVSCYDLATSEIFGLGAADVTRALNAASRRRMSLEAALREAAAQPETAPFARRALEVVERLLASIDRHRSMSSERTTGELLYHFMTSSGWLGRLTREADETGDERVQNVARFFEIVRRQSALLRDDRLPFLVEQLDTLIDAGDDPSTAEADLDAGDAVHVLTYHRAKGLEFPVVFMVGLVEDRFPSRDRRDALSLPASVVHDAPANGDHHLAEERRLFYVGMTRAAEEDRKSVV